ncbi:MAG: hypothetical protein KAS04_04680 [Candidatus Aenigmarchaeota archaeon]|nr:hypothetical protein [Candidatus Aenigmarchaeota archaeon]
MEWSRILKTGAVSGAIYGVLQGIVSILSYVFYRAEIMKLIQGSLPKNVEIPMTIEQLVDMGMMFALPGSIIGGIIAGIVFAFIFAIMYNELVGKTSAKKGLLLSVLLAVAIALGELTYQGVLGGIFLVTTRFLMLAPLSFVFFIALGYLEGIFYDKFEEKHPKRHK